MEQPRGLERLAALGTAKLDSVARRAGALYMGLDIPSFAARVRSFAGAQPTDVDARPRIELE